MIIFPKDSASLAEEETDKANPAIRETGNALDEQWDEGDDSDTFQEKIWNAIGDAIDKKALVADDCEWDDGDDSVYLSYGERDWRNGLFGPDEDSCFVDPDGIADDIESDLEKIRDELSRSSGFGFEFRREDIEKAVKDNEKDVYAGDIRVKRDGDGQPVSVTKRCDVRIPCTPTGMLGEKENHLPDEMVNEAFRILRSLR